MDKRFERCINSRACSVQERLQIMNDMNDDMRTTLRRMDGGCATADYHDCIDPQSDEVQRWHTVYSRMWKMMKTMEMPVSSSPKGDKK